MTVWKWSGDSRYPGAFPPVLETFRRVFRDSRSVAQQCWTRLHSSSNIVGATHVHYAWFTKTYGCILPTMHTAGPNIVGSCCIRLQTAANTHAALRNCKPCAKPRANGCIIVGQQLPTSLDVCCVRLHILLHVVACCWDRFQTLRNNT